MARKTVRVTDVEPYPNDHWRLGVWGGLYYKFAILHSSPRGDHAIRLSGSGDCRRELTAVSLWRCDATPPHRHTATPPHTALALQRHSATARRHRSALLVGRQQRIEVLEEVDGGGRLLVVILLNAAVQVDL